MSLELDWCSGIVDWELDWCSGLVDWELDRCSGLMTGLVTLAL